MSRALKQVLGPLVVLVLLAVGFGIAVWAPWHSDAHERELAWIHRVATWAESSSARHLPRADCAAAFAQEVGAPPSERLRPPARIARDGCGGSDTRTHWLDVEWQVRSNLVDSRFAAAETTEEPRLAAALRPFTQRAVSVHCWPGDAWDGFNEEWRIFARNEWVVAGFADPPRRAVHLSPDVCEPLRRFFGTAYAPYLSDAALYLSEALVTLVHEGEHVLDPHASEATVECYAVQDVRELVRNAGRGKGYANEMVGLAWDISYPHMPASYRTRRCRDGGRLDRHPASPVWP